MRKEKVKIDSLDNNSDLISIADIFLIIAKNIKIFFFIPITICGFVAINLTYFSSESFLADMKIMHMTKKPTSNFSISDFNSIDETFQQINPNMLDIVKSRSMAKKIIYSEFETINYNKKRTLVDIWSDDNDNNKQNLKLSELLNISKFLAQMRIREDPKTNIFTISFSSFDPKLCSEILKRLVIELNSYYQNFNKQKINNKISFIEKRIYDVENSLKDKEKSLKDFLVSNRLIDNSPLLTLEKKRLDREVDSLSDLFLNLKRELEKFKIEYKRNFEYVIIIDPPEIPVNRNKPNKTLTMLLWGGVSLFLSLFASLFIEFKNSIYLKDNLELKKLVNIKNILIKSFLKK